MTLSLEAAKTLLAQHNRLVRLELGAPHCITLKHEYIAVMDDNGREYGQIDRSTLDQLIHQKILGPGSFDGISIHTFKSILLK